MIDLSDCIELGKITKCHGIRGQVVLRLNNLSFDDIKEMESVFIEIDGLAVPFFISNYSERSRDTLVLTVDDIERGETAKDLIDCKVYLKSSQLELSENIVPKPNLFIGYTVIDKQEGKLGIIQDVLDIDKNPLLRILNNKKEILLPLHEDFILNIDARNMVLHVEAPEGLIDIS